MLYSNEPLEVGGQKVLSITYRKKHKHPSESLEKEETLYCFDCVSSSKVLWGVFREASCMWEANLVWLVLPGTALTLSTVSALLGALHRWLHLQSMSSQLLACMFLFWVHGNMPVHCLLIITYAIIFCLIGCVFIRWSPDRRFAVAQWLLWFAAYKLVWEAANGSLAAVGFGVGSAFSVLAWVQKMRRKSLEGCRAAHPSSECSYVALVRDHPVF